jgi:hypothetical protein
MIEGIPPVWHDVKCEKMQPWLVSIGWFVIGFTTLIYVFGMSIIGLGGTKQLIGNRIGIITMENHHL